MAAVVDKPGVNDTAFVSAHPEIPVGTEEVSRFEFRDRLGKDTF